MTRHTPTTTLDLELVATRIARSGPAAHPHDLDRIASRARALGITTPSVDVLTDDDAPAVVRLRAFSHVAAALARGTSAPTARRPAPDLVRAA